MATLQINFAAAINANLPDASLTQNGIVQLSSTINDDEDKAVTPKAVKSAISTAGTVKSVNSILPGNNGDVALPTINTNGGAGSPGFDLNIQTPNSVIITTLDAVNVPMEYMAWLYWAFNGYGLQRGTYFGSGDYLFYRSHNADHGINDPNGFDTMYPVASREWVTSQLANSTPVSSIAWPSQTLPSGYLKCNGQSFSTSTYPQLAIVYPSGVLPDLRAAFIRGLDDGKGVDVGRAVLSLQDDALQGHGHRRATFRTNKEGNTTATIWSFSENFNVTANFDSLDIITDGVHGEPRIATETLPRNIAFNYIVRAA